MSTSIESRPQLNALEVFSYEKTNVIAGNMAIGEMIALKPIVENMGLNWSSQLKRLKREDPNNQLWSYEKFVAEDNKSYDMVCMNPFNFQNWLYSFTPSPNMKIGLWEEYKKGLVLHLLMMLKVSMEEVVRLRHIEREHEYFTGKYLESIELDTKAIDYNKRAKVFWKDRRTIQNELYDMAKKNTGQYLLNL